MVGGQPRVLSSAIPDFHPRLIGLTGSEEQIKQVAKVRLPVVAELFASAGVFSLTHMDAQAYRVYYSRPDTGSTTDYLVDHTIIVYLLDPQGDFAAYYGQNATADDMAARIAKHIANYAIEHKK